MAQHVKICYAKLGIDSDRISSTSIRGFFGNHFADIAEFHHHSDLSYHYPAIQYKKIGKELIIIGISKYADVVFEKFSLLDKIVLKEKSISLPNVEIQITKDEIKQSNINYKFVTPWIALNEKNYTLFIKLLSKERKLFLEKILTANILSMLKGLGIRIEFRINTEISKMHSKTVTVHHNKFVGFYCDWTCNITIPRYFGLGKSISKGYGVVVKNDS